MPKLSAEGFNDQEQAINNTYNHLTMVGMNQERILWAEEEKRIKALEALRLQTEQYIYEDRLSKLRRSSAEYAEVERKLIAIRELNEQRALDISLRSYENIYQYANAQEKQNILLREQGALEERQARVELEYEVARASAVTAQEKAAATRAYHAEQKVLMQNLADVQRRYDELADERARKSFASFENYANARIVKINSINEALEKSTKAIEDKAKAKTEYAEKLTSSLGSRLEGATSADERKGIVRQTATAVNLANLENEKARILKHISDSVSNIDDKFGTLIDDAMTVVTQYQSRIDARLQDSGKTFSSISNLMSKNLAVSPYVAQKEMIENVLKLTEEGIGYNIEQRAFLATISDKIATTFDATNQTLLRLIRLQQSDITISRLGSEANLTRFFNTMFQDTSYFNNMYDAVSSAIIDANSQLTAQESSAFEYTVQKWLGSLSALGFSDTTVSQIAQGLNLIGSGDVMAMASNEQLQSLFAMAASRIPDVDYTELFMGGLTAENTNKLLRAMVEYLQEIAESNNQVVKAAYGNVFNLSVSDLRAVSNLTAQDISNIFAQQLNYEGAVQEVNQQLTQVASRMSIAQLIENVFSNAAYSLGMGVAENPVEYIMWKVINSIEDVTGGTRLPAFSVMGNMVDMSAFTIEGILKSGIIGISSLSMIGDIVNSLRSKGGLDLSKWGATQYTSRGTGLAPTDLGVTTGTSFSAQVVTSSSSDIAGASLEGAASSDYGMQGRSTQSAEQQRAGEKTVDDVYNMMFLERSKPVRVEVSNTVKANVKDMSSSLIAQIASATSDSDALQSLAGFFNVASTNEEGEEIHYTMQELLDAIRDRTQQFDVNVVNWNELPQAMATTPFALQNPFSY